VPPNLFFRREGAARFGLKTCIAFPCRSERESQLPCVIMFYSTEEQRVSDELMKHVSAAMEVRAPARTHHAPRTVPPRIAVSCGVESGASSNRPGHVYILKGAVLLKLPPAALRPCSVR
jgi:hypothetical protein